MQPSLVVIELVGGNDVLNTVIPYSNGLYYDYRPGVGIPQDQVTPINDDLAFNPSMGAVKDLWDQGSLAVINGIGYSNASRSHFRSRDIWHTAQPEAIGNQGWLGAAIRDLDPTGENVLTGVNFGRGLPRALVCKGVPVTSVGALETYGLLPDIADDTARSQALDALARMYGPAGGRDIVAQALSENGAQALRGADALRAAPLGYSSDVEYADTPISQSLRSAAQVMTANLGARVLYAQHGSFDTHSNELLSHAKLWRDLSAAIGDFTADLKAARPLGQHPGVGLVRIRTPRPRQRHWLRPRLRRRRLRLRRTSPRRTLRRIPLTNRPLRRRPSLHQRLPLHLRHSLRASGYT